MSLKTSIKKYINHEGGAGTKNKKIIIDFKLNMANNIITNRKGEIVETS
jgi:hypothetical protein